MRLANVKKAARKKQKVVVVKEINEFKIDEHDFQQNVIIYNVL